MHRFLKQQGSSAAIDLSEYCPLDLFSGEESRVWRAVGELWKGWVTTNGQGNQMRVFVGGKTVMPADVGLSSSCLFLFSESDGSLGTDSISRPGTPPNRAF